MIAKLKVAEEEADESGFWMELLVESGCIAARCSAKLMEESSEITAMFVASIKTLRAKPSNRKS